MKYKKLLNDTKNWNSGLVIADYLMTEFMQLNPDAVLVDVPEEEVFKPWVLTTVNDLYQDNIDDSIAGYAPNGDPIYR